MKFRLIFLAFAFIKTFALRNEIKMIADIVHSYNKPTSVLARVCWEPSVKISLFLELNKLKPPRTVGYIKSIDDIDVSSINKDLVIVTDMNCPDSKIFLKLANVINKFRNPHRWIILKTCNNTQMPDYNLKDLSILPDSDIIVAIKEGNHFSLVIPYKIHENNTNLKMEFFGTWTAENGLDRSENMNIPTSMRRKNLEGLTIVTSTVISDNSTKTELNSSRNIHIDILSKVGYRQMSSLYDFLNATRALVFTDNWGYLINGSYNGMIGDLVRGNAELTGTVLFQTKTRLKLLDYLSYPSPLISVKFVFRQPSLSYQNNLFILSFKPQVWLCIFGLVLLMTLIVFINARWESVKFKDDMNDRTTLRPNMSDITMVIIGAITQQGSYTELKGTLGRVVMFLMFLMFLFLYTSYSANIVALLQSNSNEIKTLSDLLNSKLELGTEDTPYNRHHFSTATEPIRKAIYETKIAPRGTKPNFMALEDGVKKLQTKPFAFNMNLGVGYKLVERYFLEYEKCGLQEIEYIQESKPWQTCRKNSPYKEMYKIGFFRNQEHGLNDRENRLTYAKKPICSVHGSSFGSVNMTDFYPALLILLYGMLLAVILMLLEILYWRRCVLRRINQKQPKFYN